MKSNLVVGYCNWQKEDTDERWTTECGHDHVFDRFMKHPRFLCPFCCKYIASTIRYSDHIESAVGG
jgi:hypothetical protein